MDVIFLNNGIYKNIFNTFVEYLFLEVRPFGSYYFIARFTCPKKKKYTQHEPFL